LRKKNASRDPAARPHASQPLGEVSADIIEFRVRDNECVSTVDNHRFAVVFVDGFSRYKHAYMMHTKDEALDAIKDFVRQVGKPRRLLTDKDSVFIRGAVQRYCLDNGIAQVQSPPYRASFNGLVERSNREIKEIARSMLLDSGLPPQFWGHAILAATYTSNRISGISGPTPYELMAPVSHGRAPDVTNLRVFGSPCYSYVEKEHRLAANAHAHAEKGVFLGYDHTSPGYVVYVPARKQILVRHEVVCDESFESGVDVLLGKYVKDLDDITEYNAIVSVSPTPRTVTQSDLDRLFRPTPSLGPAKRLNPQHDRLLRNTCTSPAAHIRTRCAALDGKTFNQARHIMFATSDKRGSPRRYYSKTDFLWDIKHGHLQLDYTPTVEERTAAVSNQASYSLEQCALSAITTGDEPLDRRDAQTRADWPKWLAAEQTEVQELTSAGTYEWVPDSEPTSRGKKVISCKFAYKQKVDRAKARLCARGFLQTPDEVGNKYAPVCRPETMRCMLALAQRHRWGIRAFDIRNAYVQAPLTRPVYVNPPDGYQRPGQVWRLNKALYGLPGSGRAWYKCFDRFMRSKHFKPSPADPCLYVHSSKRLFLCTHVDDCLLIGDNSLLPTALSHITQQYQIRDLGFPRNLLGLQLTRTPDHLTLTCETFCASLLRRFDIPPKDVTTPLPSTTHLVSFDASDTKPDSSRYRQMVGCINFAATHARPDISAAAHQLSRHLNNPSHAHMRAAERVIQHLHCTRHLGPRYHTDRSHPVTTFSDSDWAGCIDTRQSTSGRVTMMQGAAVLWASARQKSIALSSAEAEMVALNSAARDARFIRRLHASIGLAIVHPTPLMVDNSAALQWAGHKAKWSASRHISTQHFAVQDWKRRGHVLPLKVDTSRQLADICTKSLPHATHVLLRTLVLGHRQAISAAYDFSSSAAAV
jgi:transposase InsO family protein